MELYLFIQTGEIRVADICSQGHLGWVVPVQLGVLFQPESCRLVQASLTQPGAWHHRLHPAQVVGEHLQHFQFDEKLKRSPQSGGLTGKIRTPWC